MFLWLQDYPANLKTHRLFGEASPVPHGLRISYIPPEMPHVVEATESSLQAHEIFNKNMIYIHGLEQRHLYSTDFRW